MSDVGITEKDPLAEILSSHYNFTTLYFWMPIRNGYEVASSWNILIQAGLAIMDVVK